jgi:hypothetical protein
MAAGLGVRHSGSMASQWPRLQQTGQQRHLQKITARQPNKSDAEGDEQVAALFSHKASNTW